MTFCKGLKVSGKIRRTVSDIVILMSITEHKFLIFTALNAANSGFD
jgi:hypothetical protein